MAAALAQVLAGLSLLLSGTACLTAALVPDRWLQ